jgi:hypothetical protein
VTAFNRLVSLVGGSTRGLCALVVDTVSDALRLRRWDGPEETSVVGDNDNSAPAVFVGFAGRTRFNLAPPLPPRGEHCIGRR